MKLAIVTTHPIQYNAPFFRGLHRSEKLSVHVFYTLGEVAKQGVQDKGFGMHIQWDIDLLSGYPHTFVENVSADAGSHRFNGVKNPDLITSIQQFAPDAVLVYGWKFKSHLQTMRFFKGKIPVIFRGDSTLVDDVKGVKTHLRHLVLRYAYRFVDAALYVGSENRAYYRKAGMHELQLFFVPHAIEHERFADNSYNQPALDFRKKMGIKPEEFVFLFAGKFEPKKNPLLLLEAAIELHKKSSKLFHVVFVGQGVLSDELQKRAAMYDFVHFLPFQNQQTMPVLYRVADIFVLPSKGPGETWGLAVNEAMASGRAVIVSNKVGCADDLVKKYEHGYYFQSENKEALIACMKNALDNGKQTLSKKGIDSQIFISKWSVDEAVKSCVDALMKIKEAV